MGWDDNVYYNPEKHGLEIVTEFEFTDRDYQFDTAVIWRRLEDGALFAGRDSGCSCPSPFENVHGVEDLSRVTNVRELESAIGGFELHSYGGPPAASMVEWQRELARVFN